jgi:serine/threonine-protein kinase
MSDDASVGSEAAVRRLVKRCPECDQHYSADSMFCPFDGTQLEEAVWVAPTDPTVDPLLGTVVDGRYRVERVLGEGGTGTVYEVMHEALRRPFAMKVVRRDVARDPALASRFIQEARATASLKHPHIVSITDFGRLPDQTPYYVMERLVGQTLAQVEKAHGPLPLDRGVRIVLQVADALATAHEAGIVHRDLKPENLFMVGSGADGDGDGRVDDVRVVDFGAAKIAGGTRITKTGIVFGTPHYMSPEQASGQPVDHRADIYALGVIMYELFTGHLPFEADTLMGVLTKHMFVEPPGFNGPTAEVDPERTKLMGGLESVTLRAMAKKPERRIQTMAALVAELEKTVSFEGPNRVVLAPDWREPPRTSTGRAIAALPRAVEGSDRAEIYPSGDLPVVPGTSWRGTIFVGLGVAAVAGVVAIVALRSPGATATPPVAEARPLETAGAAPVAAPPPVPSSPPSPTAVHLTSTPPFAEVWSEGHRIGTAPIDIAIDPTGAPTRCTLRAPGYVERSFVVDQTSTAPMQVTLDPAAPAAATTPPRRPAPTKSSPRPKRPSDGELVDPFR